MNAYIQGIILAAESNNNTSILNHDMCGQPLLLYPISLLHSLSLPITTIIDAHDQKAATIIKKAYPNDQQSHITVTTSDATGISCSMIKQVTTHNTSQHILITSAHMPLLNKKLITDFSQQHIKNDAALSLVTSCDPSLHYTDTYNRIAKKGSHVHVITPEDIDKHNEEYCCLKAAICLVTQEFLHAYLETTSPDHLFSFTDLITYANEQKHKINIFATSYDTIRSVHNFEQLWAAEHIKRSELIKFWMKHDVRFLSAQTIAIDLSATIGRGTIISSGVHILGNTHIGNNCVIREFSTLENATIGDQVTIGAQSIITQHTIPSNTQITAKTHLGALNTSDIAMIETPTIPNTSSSQPHIRFSCAQKTDSDTTIID